MAFTVSATGFSAYQWFFNGTNAIAGATNSALTLSGVAFPQSGAYTVAVSNRYGSVTSPPAWLTVLDPFILTQPGGHSADPGSTTWFSIRVGGTSPIGFQWLKEGQALRDGASVSGAESDTLTLGNILDGDAGAYSVIVTNCFGAVTSAVASLTVNSLSIACCTASPLMMGVVPGGRWCRPAPRSTGRRALVSATAPSSRSIWTAPVMLYYTTLHPAMEPNR